MTYLNSILDYIDSVNPRHSKKLKKNIDFNNKEYVDRAENFFKNYEAVLVKENKDMKYAIDSYLRFCEDIVAETIGFVRSGEYSSSSFEEVNNRVYNNPDVMSYHMHGLAMSQYLWEHHYSMLEFFFKNVNKFSEGVKNVLEIGGGHGLYTNELLDAFKFDFNYTMVDISETSIEMSKLFVKGDKVKYVHQDIYEYAEDGKFDLIIMGEVLEHVEDPLGLMKKLHALGTPNATAFLTVPCNAPTIDHIYLFKNPGELKELYSQAGWDVALDFVVSAEKEMGTIDDPLVPVMYAAFLKKK